MHATTNATTVATFTSFTATVTIVPNTSSIASICKAKNIKREISRSIWIYRLLKVHIDNVIAMGNCIKLSSNTFALTTFTFMPRGIKVKF